MFLSRHQIIFFNDLKKLKGHIAIYLGQKLKHPTCYSPLNQWKKRRLCSDRFISTNIANTRWNELSMLSICKSIAKWAVKNLDIGISYLS